ncbi:MAG: hypothetical protein ABR555_06715 [Pyrinomonadaceae bacterium]
MSKSWLRDNWLQGAERSLGRGSHMYALAKAWSWLESKALVAPNPDQSSPQARIITRAGSRALAGGSLAEIQAAERIGLDLPTSGSKLPGNRVCPGARYVRDPHETFHHARQGGYTDEQIARAAYSLAGRQLSTTEKMRFLVGVGALMTFSGSTVRTMPGFGG